MKVIFSHIHQQPRREICGAAAAAPTVAPALGRAAVCSRCEPGAALAVALLRRPASGCSCLLCSRSFCRPAPKTWRRSENWRSRQALRARVSVTERETLKEHDDLVGTRARIWLPRQNELPRAGVCSRWGKYAAFRANWWTVTLVWVCWLKYG